jgi:diguanylate cyclase (GGDEF)-like protein
MPRQSASHRRIGAKRSLQESLRLALARLWRDFESWGDPVSRDLGASGERFVAQVRLVLVLVLSLIPIKSVLDAPAETDNWIGLGSIGVALVFSLVFLTLGRRPDPPRWLPLVTSQFDIALISLGSLGFVLAGNPLTATNGLVHYTVYYVALAAACLRHDPRVCLAAGAAAVLEHGAIVAWVGLALPPEARISTQYGTFAWDNQIGRIELLVIATVLDTAIVIRSRRFWLGSMRDRLTGLFNRGFFDESLTRLLDARLRSRRPFAIALADLDHFKAINDRFGHAEGDIVLRQAAVLLQEAFRGKDLVARYGGEEFGALLFDLDKDAAASRLDAWRAALAADRRDPPLTTSVGVAAFPDDGDTPAGLLATADRRLYAAKHAGRNRVVANDDPGSPGDRAAQGG